MKRALRKFSKNADRSGSTVAIIDSFHFFFLPPVSFLFHLFFSSSLNVQPRRLERDNVKQRIERGRKENKKNDYEMTPNNSIVPWVIFAAALFRGCKFARIYRSVPGNIINRRRGRKLGRIRSWVFWRASRIVDEAVCFLRFGINVMKTE